MVQVHGVPAEARRSRIEVVAKLREWLQKLLKTSRRLLTTTEVRMLNQLFLERRERTMATWFSTYEVTTSKPIVQESRRAKKKEALAEIAPIYLGSTVKTSVDQGPPDSDLHRVMEHSSIGASVS